MLLMLRGLFRMLNNKGQTLVLFVIVLPILMFMLILVIDIGKIISLKYELNNISDIVLSYGIDNIDKEEVINELDKLVRLNKSDIDNIDVYIENNRIYVHLKENYNGIFSGFIDISVFDVETSYVGYIENNEKRIEKLGD